MALIKSYISKGIRAEEMTQHLRTVAALPFPLPTLQFTTVTPVSGEMASSHRHSYRQNTNAHKNKF